MDTNENTMQVLESMIKRYDILRKKIDSVKKPNPQENPKRRKDDK